MHALDDRYHPDSVAPEYGFEGGGLLAPEDEMGNLPDKDNLKGELAGRSSIIPLNRACLPLGLSRLPARIPLALAQSPSAASWTATDRSKSGLPLDTWAEESLLCHCQPAILRCCQADASTSGSMVLTSVLPRATSRSYIR